jgi:hypothetical protein
LADAHVFQRGGYRYLPGVFQYSAGVTAEPGFLIERARLARPLPLEAGFEAIDAHLAVIGRPRAALCACELRSPEPFSEDGFATFNRQYAGILQQWGMFDEVDRNPVARTNVCPEWDAPDTPSVYAFSYTVPSETTRGSFIVAGSGETPEGMGNYRDHIVRLGETSPDAMREKIRYVMATMESRLAGLGFAWADASATQLYTVHDVGGHVRDEFVARGAAAHGLTWHVCRPPVVDIEFEMDVHNAGRQIVL